MNQITPFPPRPADFEDGWCEETVRWRGGPSWWAAATRIWRVRLVAFYFALLLADGLRQSFGNTPAAALALQGEIALLVIASVAVATLLLLGWLTARTTTYTITDASVTMKYGIALRATLVIPFAAIQRMAVRVHKDQIGDIAIHLKGGQGVMYPKLWPHVRPWSLFKAEPMLRSVPRAGLVGSVLARGIGAHAEALAELTGKDLEPVSRENSAAEFAAV